MYLIDFPFDVTVGEILNPLLIINKNIKYIANKVQLKNNKFNTTSIK